MIREQELRYVMEAIANGDCASIVGLSNMGKSALLRELGAPATHKRFRRDDDGDWTFVYVDCNLMPERSEQALHEVILRSLIGTLKRNGLYSKTENKEDKLVESLSGLYQQVVQPPSPIRSPLAFEDAIGLVCEQPGKTLTIGFDEFDDPFGHLNGRVFLNLRAVKDKFAHAISFITATEKPLPEIRSDGEASEFIELFANRVQWVGLLSQGDSHRVVTDAAKAEAGKLHEDEIAFIVEQAGGHPALLGAVTNVWRRIASGAPDAARKQALSLIAQALDSDPTIRAECVKLWSQLSTEEHDALVALAHDKRADAKILAQLRTKRLLPATNDSNSTNNPIVLGEVMRNFVKRQVLTKPGLPLGVQVDIDAGEVSVDGQKVEPLTELEYKLLLLLYGRLNKIVDKYTIVTNVWGENYLDSVDDARIEKLVSRLRSKLEPNVAEPKYLITLRGRGYKLLG
jgi:hypothetical protein